MNKRLERLCRAHDALLAWGSRPVNKKRDLLFLTGKVASVALGVDGTLLGAMRMLKNGPSVWAVVGVLIMWLPVLVTFDVLEPKNRERIKTGLKRGLKTWRESYPKTMLEIDLLLLSLLVAIVILIS